MERALNEGAQILGETVTEMGIKELNSKMATLSTLTFGSIQSGRNTRLLHITAPTIIFNQNPASDEEARYKLIQQLSPSLPSDDRAKLIYAKGRIREEVFQWIMQSAEYTFWERESSGTQLLWINGPPATGKTMFSLYLTQELERKELKNAVVLYYFCLGRELDRRSPTSVLRGLMKLFIHRCGERAEEIVLDLRRKGPSLFRQLVALWRMFRNMVNTCSFETVYCVVDGLDECSESSMDDLKSFVEILKRDFDRTKCEEIRGIPIDATEPSTKRGSTTSPAFKLVILSREEPSCLKEFECFNHIQISKNESNEKCTVRDATDKMGSTELASKDEHSPKDGQENKTESTAIDSEIARLQALKISSIHKRFPEFTHEQELRELRPPSNALNPYICERIAQISKYKGWSEDLTQKLEETLGTYNDGTFLWIEAAIDLLSRASQSEARRLSFASETTQSMWRAILLDIPIHLRPVVRFLLKWLSVAFIPLKLTQLEDVWCFFSGFRYPSSGAHRVIQEAFEACNFLLERGREDDINIKHQEVLKFLTWNPSGHDDNGEINPFYFRESDAHCEITKVSINYIEQSIFQERNCDLEIDNKTGQIILREDGHVCLVPRPFIQYSARFWPEHAKEATSATIKFDSPFFNDCNIARQNWFRVAWGIACHTDSKSCPKFQSRLHLAAFFDLEEWAQYLCSLDGWNREIEKRNLDFLTPLFVAAARDNTKVFAVLLDHGAERSIMDENVFHFACRIGSRGIVRLLIERTVDLNETTSAIGVLQCLTSAFRLLPGLSGIVNMRRSSGWKDVLFMQFFGEKTTPLQNAVLGGHEDIVEMLLVHKADVNRATLQNGTAAHIAGWKGTPNILELLEKYGADFRQRTSTGWYPIHCAAAHGNEAGLRWLLTHGAFIDAVTAAGETPLHLVAKHGLDHTAKLLLDSKAAIDIKTIKGFTPLHVAAQSGNDNVVMLLVMYGADQSVLTLDGETALQLAESASRNSSAQILRSAKWVEKGGERCVTSEEKIGIPQLGVPQIPLPEFVLDAMETGLSKLSAYMPNTLLDHSAESNDDIERPRRYHGHHRRHHQRDDVNAENTSEELERERVSRDDPSTHVAHEGTADPMQSAFGKIFERWKPLSDLS